MTYTYISGATGGIGKAFCIACAKKGYNIFMTARNEDRLNELKAQLQKIADINVEYLACEMTDERSRLNLIEYIAQKNLVFDRIINVAGVDIQKAFTAYTYEKVLTQIRVNAESTISLTHALINHRADNLEILTISSMSGVSPMPYFALYSATKAMLTNFFTALHYELKKDKVKVTTVLPGGVYTRPDVIADIKGQGLWGKLSAKQPEFVAEKSLKAVKRNKIKYMPGFFNKFLNFLMKLAPKRIVLSYIARRWKKQTKDAF